MTSVEVLPFHILLEWEKNCFIDQWFEIDCKQNRNISSRPFLKKLNLEVLEILLPKSGSLNPGLIEINIPVFSFYCRNRSMSSSKPFLKKLNLEVLEIELQRLPLHHFIIRDNHIRVNNPVFSSYCSRSNVSSPGIPVNFKGSPFVYSHTSNSFTPVGCDSRALISDTEKVLSGCFSTCGGGCCQATIPSNLQMFNVSFEGADECKYASLVEKNWSRTDLSCAATMKDLEYVPAMLEWGIFNSSEEALTLMSEYHQNYYCSDSTSLQGTLQCYCAYGYNGTPYHPGSCQGLSVGLGLPILIFVAWKLRRAIKKRNKIKRKKMFFKRNGGLLLEQQVSSSRGSVVAAKVFTSKELEIATDHFNKNRILGQGSQGTVYKGMLPDGKIVAVKKSKIESEGTLNEQFINEVVILAQINHRNIVKLLGCCLETEVPLLVYEFVSNGTLSQYLHGQVEDFLVSWEMRMQIATETAGDLHSSASIPIYHRDIKSSNILLDDKYNAKVADFGTSRSVSIEQTHLTTLVQGTFGYLDPEYFQSSQFTDKSDVYSFGVVLVELLTGQKAISSLRIQEGRSLAIYFINTMEENHLSDILDTQVVTLGGEHEVMAFTNLAKRCLDLNGRNRPTMIEVRMDNIT